ncbi:MAG: AmmeMemoRadiSam system protein A [Candidatus Latescibacterota bacterium]
MGPMCSPEGELGADERCILLQVARQSVRYGVDCGLPLVVRAADYPPPLQRCQATFVTLRVAEELRGCIGTCLPVRPLVEDVAHNAYAAGFLDPRFAPLSGLELPGLHIHISLLSVPEPMSFTSEEELLAQVRAGVDGLLLEEGVRRGTLLPAVWDSLPDPRQFLRHLKLKAGLPPDYWSGTLRVLRYTAESVE